MAAKSEKSTKAASTRSAPKTTTRRSTTSRRKTGEINDDMIAERAYILHLDDPGASEVDNWLRAESELRGT